MGLFNEKGNFLEKVPCRCPRTQGGGGSRRFWQCLNRSRFFFQDCFSKVTTKSYQGYYWTPKIAQNWPKWHNKLFFCPKDKKSLGRGRSGPYFLVMVNCVKWWIRWPKPPSGYGIKLLTILNDVVHKYQSFCEIFSCHSLILKVTFFSKLQWKLQWRKSQKRKKKCLITNQQQIYKEKLQRSNNSLFLIFFWSILFLKISECVNM